MRVLGISAFYHDSAAAIVEDGRIVAAVSVSGPLERLSRQPGRLHAAAVVSAANRLTEVLRRTAD